MVRIESLFPKHKPQGIDKNWEGSNEDLAWTYL